MYPTEVAYRDTAGSAYGDTAGVEPTITTMPTEVGGT
jgi:hypothetical protein